MAESSVDQIIVRHFRQIVLWPLQLVPEGTSNRIQRNWEDLSAVTENNPWTEVLEEFDCAVEDFEERHYHEFVTFLPYVQRFLYGSRVGRDDTSREHERSVRVFRRRDITQARITYSDDASLTFEVGHVDLHFFHDVDIVIHALELWIDDIPLDRAQDTMFRFGRAYPGFWESTGEGGNCPRAVEWLDASGNVQGVSDYGERARYLTQVARDRTPRLSAHWQYLLAPLKPAYAERSGPLRFRSLEHYRMPHLAYLAFDDPTALSRVDFVRIALGTQPGPPDVPPFSESSLATFEADYCEDRYWDRPGAINGSDARIMTSGRFLAIVGRHGDPFFSNAETGILGQFRQQYFLLFLIAHFHRSALLSMSDQLAIAMHGLDIGNIESVKGFKRGIRQAMEIFLRFTHRFWYHQISNQDIVKSLFQRTRDHLGTDLLYEEVRQEMIDMNAYLDSDSLRRQAHTILRLTVVTIVGLIATVGTGYLGMNLIAAADEPLALRAGFFVLVIVATTMVILVTVAQSRRLSDFIDVLSNDRVGWGEKWSAFRQSRKSRPRE